MRIACVVQRFGPEVAGGSEAHCLSIAERLAERHEVTVLTSCATDYISWRNELPPGESRVGKLTVVRFESRPRDVSRFHELSHWVFSGRAPAEDELEWFRLNGPEMPDLLDYLDRHGDDFDLILFWSYRYYQSFFGLPRVADRAVLVPTAEEDPAIHLSVLRGYFSLPAGMLYLTPEEARLVGGRAARTPPSAVVGFGLEPPTPDPAARERLAARGVPEEFALYVGRIDPNKGCETLFRYFRRHLEQGGRPVQLVLAGRPAMEIPDHPSITSLGFVSPEERDALLSHARLLFMPSPFESLSIVLLEAWNQGRPALVNGHCQVLKGQTLRANGGLYYLSFPEFTRALDLLLERPVIADRLGQQGQHYVESHYRWPRVMAEIESFLARIVSGTDEEAPSPSTEGRAVGQ